MRHLTTEELLRHFDGELIPEHIDRCAFCQEAMVGLQALLYEVQLELKRSVPAEPALLREASLERLRGEMRPPAPVVAFPEWRRPAYGIAATILMAALGGYLALNSSSSSVDQTAVAALRVSDEVRESTDFASAPARSIAAVSSSTTPSPTSVAPTPIAAVVEVPAAERFVLPYEAAQPAEPVALAEAPTFEIAWNGSPSPFQTWTNPNSPVPEPLAAAASEVFESAPVAPVTVETASAAVEGHWLLAKAGVWQEDIRPELRPELPNARLYFVGTVEDEATRRRVIQSLSRAASETEIAFDLRPRDKETLLTRTTFAAETPRPSQSPSGGVVRTSLLAHFSDAARRSFQTPEPSLLEAELDRYVSDIFRGQSRLLAHSYALNHVLGGLGSEQVDQFAPKTKHRLRDLIRLHLSALRDEEAALYDRLSEVLPRRYWAYRADKAAAGGEVDWLQQGKALLADALQLDSTLTSLFNGVPGTVRADQVNRSCGELLSRLRGHIAHFKAPLEALQ